MEINRSDLSQKFIDLFVGTLKFTEEEFELMLSHFRLELIPRNFFYLKAGNTSKQKAYINKGSTRTFTIDAKAREHILFFSFDCHCFYVQRFSLMERQFSRQKLFISVLKMIAFANNCTNKSSWFYFIFLEIRFSIFLRFVLILFLVFLWKKEKKRR